ncbi:hypothetical protein AG4045_028434 [Apium graveolens]|uniref:Uncharacterized protein n=1 Tax=Apium graveolens TaxID=4045 RepID=A0A6L5BBY3_APIGR|nr:hypothetical protein AG4045_028434 [Apium graveolens]
MELDADIADVDTDDDLNEAEEYEHGWLTDSDDHSSTDDSDNLFYRDFSAPTGVDKMDETI